MTAEKELGELRRLVAELSARLARSEAETLTIAHAAERLDISDSTLRRMVRRRQIRVVSIGGRAMVPASEIRRLATPQLPLPKKTSGGRSTARAQDATPEDLKALFQRTRRSDGKSTGTSGTATSA